VNRIDALIQHDLALVNSLGCKAYIAQNSEDEFAQMCGKPTASGSQFCKTHEDYYGTD